MINLPPPPFKMGRGCCVVVALVVARARRCVGKRGIAAAHCHLPDAHAKWEKDPFSRGRHRVDVFVSGVEGAGHHGAVGGFLAPFLAEVLGVDRARCLEVDENPFYVSLNHLRRRCRAFAMIGWESFPSDRRLQVRDRLAALYEGPHCFPQPKPAARGPGFVAAFPPAWASANPLDRDGCWRCGSWEATLEDVYARLARSDRLDVAALATSMTSLRVVVLWRDFARAAFSHAQLDGKGRGHAMVLAASPVVSVATPVDRKGPPPDAVSRRRHAALMARDAAALPPATWRVLRYEALLEPAGYVEAGVAVAAFLDLPAVR